MTLRGEFTQAILLAILEQPEGSYAVPIRKTVERLVGRRVSRGALYTALERLEDKGFVTSKVSAPMPVRGGKGRRYYQLTPEGVRHLSAARKRLQRLWAFFDEQIGGAEG